MVTTRTFDLSGQVGSKFHSANELRVDFFWMRDAARVCRDLMQPRAKKNLSTALIGDLRAPGIVLASIKFAHRGVRLVSMGVKSEKTFEEIVERIVALFRPAPAPSNTPPVPPQPPSPAPDAVDRSPSSPDSSPDDTP